MRPPLNIPDAHTGQELSDDQLCVVFLLVAIATMVSVGAVIFLASDAGHEVVERMPCLPLHQPPARRSLGPPRAGTPRFFWESFGLNGLDHGLKEP